MFTFLAHSRQLTQHFRSVLAMSIPTDIRITIINMLEAALFSLPRKKLLQFQHQIWETQLKYMGVNYTDKAILYKNRKIYHPAVSERTQLIMFKSTTPDPTLIPLLNQYVDFLDTVERDSAQLKSILFKAFFVSDNVCDYTHLMPDFILQECTKNADFLNLLHESAPATLSDEVIQEFKETHAELFNRVQAAVFMYQVIG